MTFSMNLPLKCILFLMASVIGLLGKPFHVYSPSSKENTLWIVKATPKGENLDFKVAQKVTYPRRMLIFAFSHR